MYKINLYRVLLRLLVKIQKMIEYIVNVNINQIYHAFNLLIYYKQISILMFLFQKLILLLMCMFDCSNEINFQSHTYLLILTLSIISHDNHQHIQILCLFGDVEKPKFLFEF